MNFIFAHCYNYADEESQRISRFCRAAERHFQCLAEPINVSVDLKYDFLCLWVSVCVRHTRLSREE